MPLLPPASDSQAKVFLDSEGDNWFARNKAAIGAKNSFHEAEIIKRVLEFAKDSINSVLEIGCGNGAKLDDICRFFKADGSGVDPSSAAVNSGNESFAEKHGTTLKLHLATASVLPFADSSFDLVYFGFCLYLLDRNEIYKAVGEADRVLKSGGFLAILDFDPRQRHKRPYHHQSGLFSYKTSYADFFTAGGHYYLVAKDSFSHGANHFSTDSDERVSLCVLYKETDAY